jgi:hypothetical protein
MASESESKTRSLFISFQNHSMKLFTKPASRRPLRFTLLALHTSGVLQVFRTHSLFRLWTPLRENFDAEQDLLG